MLENNSYSYCRGRAEILIQLLIVLCLIHPITAQVSQEEVAQSRVRTWQNRVDGLTKDVVTDSSVVEEWERAMYLALLAKTWWKEDEKEARTFLKASSSKLLSAWTTDEKSDESQKIRFAQKTIEIISKFDPKAAQDLTADIVSRIDENKDQSQRKDSLALADLIVNLGLQVADSKRDLAVSCGIDSLAFGISGSLPQLIATINSKEPAKAELLLNKVILKVRGNYSRQSILFFYNFSKFLFEINGEETFSPKVRRTFLTDYSNLVSGAPVVEAERPFRCSIASYAPAIVLRIDAYLPEHSVAFRNSIQTCLPYLPASFQGVSGAEVAKDAPQTIDELVAAAKQTRDKELKLRFWRTALSKLETQKKHAEIISLLDSVDGDDLKSLFPIVWGDWRIDAGYQAILIALEEKDLAAAYKILDKIPGPIRPQVRMRIANKFESEKVDQFYSDNLDQLLKDVESLEIEPKDSAGFYRKLTELYIKVRPSDCEKMFASTVKFINKTDSLNPDFIADKDWAPRQDYVLMSAELLELDELNISISLNNISSRRSRVRLRLGLLESSFRKLNDAKKSLDLIKNKKKSI